jgi:hypothetical protein
MKVKEWGSGTDLGCYMVEVYKTAEIAVDTESRGTAGSYTSNLT